MFVALLILVTHSLVAHKEYRFIYPALPMIVFLAAEGSADTCIALSRRFNLNWPCANWGIAMALGWAILSATLAFADPMRTAWSRGRGGLVLLTAAREARACGIAISGLWSWTGGYSRLHSDARLHLISNIGQRDWNTRAFNAWIAPSHRNEPRQLGYVLQTCAPEQVPGIDASCLWMRPGPCEIVQHLPQ
jgi:hypothetical protein